MITNKERDAESGNGYFGARYYASTMGCFLSPDWSAKIMPVPYAKLDTPQTLNLYAFVGNNPLTNVDADGHCSGSGSAYGACMVATQNSSGSASVALEMPTQELNSSSDGPPGMNLGDDDGDNDNSGQRSVTPQNSDFKYRLGYIAGGPSTLKKSGIL